MRIHYFVLLSLCGLFACSGDGASNNTVQNSDATFLQIADENTTPTVDLKSYRLLSVAGTDRRGDAAEILKVKRRWPLAMQSKDRNEFEAILTRDFTFTAQGDLLTRSAYIEDRTTIGDWKITFVEYEDVCLQFAGDIGILTYRNKVKNVNSKTDSVEMEHMSWVDIFGKEDGKWKIKATRIVDYRLVP